MTRTEKVSLAITLAVAAAALALSLWAAHEFRECDPALVTETRGDRLFLTTECKAGARQ